MVEIISDESSLQKGLASEHWSKSRLNEALLAASALVDDSCILKPLLKAGANPNAVGPDGNTPLMNAAGAGQITNVRLLLEAGADPNMHDLARRTALSMARQRDHSEVVELLQQAHSSE